MNTTTKKHFIVYPLASNDSPNAEYYKVIVFVPDGEAIPSTVWECIRLFGLSYKSFPTELRFLTSEEYLETVQQRLKDALFEEYEEFVI